MLSVPTATKRKFQEAVNHMNHNTTIRSIGVLFACLLLIAAPADAASRSPRWAAPVEVPGVPNLHRIDRNLYRSAQPTPEGMKNLEKMGIKTIVNLRSYNDDTSETRGTDLREIRIRMHAWDPDAREIVRVLRIIADESGGPYLVHCQHGADRTGMSVAMYRMVVQNWGRDEAIDEMRNGGYGFHSIWTGIVKFLENVDVEKIKNALETAAD